MAVRKILATFWQDDSGQDIAEYAIVLAGIVVVTMAVVRLVGVSARGIFAEVARILH